MTWLSLFVGWVFPRDVPLLLIWLLFVGEWDWGWNKSLMSPDFVCFLIPKDQKNQCRYLSDQGVLTTGISKTYCSFIHLKAQALVHPWKQCKNSSSAKSCFRNDFFFTCSHFLSELSVELLWRLDSGAPHFSLKMNVNAEISGFFFWWGRGWCLWRAEAVMSSCAGGTQCARHKPFKTRAEMQSQLPGSAC